jgi:hypothetical protein
MASSRQYGIDAAAERATHATSKPRTRAKATSAPATTAISLVVGQSVVRRRATGPMTNATAPAAMIATVKVLMDEDMAVCGAALSWSADNRMRRPTTQIGDRRGRAMTIAARMMTGLTPT